MTCDRPPSGTLHMLIEKKMGRFAYQMKARETSVALSASGSLALSAARAARYAAARTAVRRLASSGLFGSSDFSVQLLPSTVEESPAAVKSTVHWRLRRRRH
jgi:hypothetical protein